jgi:hypothetical protein
VPAIGMLMIPKTLAYVAVGFLAYREMFRPGLSGAMQTAGNPS